ncbi:MAG: APC family permease [Candidatus Babeliales bacterium]
MSGTQTEKIGLAVAIIVGMNAMIGAGIFAVPAALATSVGPAGILTYAFVIAAVWCMAHSLARLASLYPEEGSFYVYAKQWGGHAMGLIATGAYLLGLTIAMGLLTQVVGAYLHHAFPLLTCMQWGALALFLLVLLNSMGVVLSEIGQIILICCTVFPIITTTLLCLNHANFDNLTPFMPYGIKNLFSATRAVIFGFFGFECAASLFAVVKDPQRNVPKALTYAIVIVGALYLLFVASLILAVPLHLFADPNMPLPKILANMFPNNTWLLYGIHAAILSATIGTLHSMIWSSGALLLAFMKHFKNPTVHRLITSGRFGAREAVIFMGSCIAVSFLVLSKPNLFFSLTALGIVFAFVSSMITLLVKHTKSWWDKETIITIIGIATAFVIMAFAIEGVIEAIC